MQKTWHLIYTEYILSDFLEIVAFNEENLVRYFVHVNLLHVLFVVQL